jgi:peptide/nickel transport system permease protein
MTGRRLLQLVPVLLGLSFITFAVLNLLPGNVALAILGQNATAQSEQQLEQELGLNRPFIVRYGDWLGDLLHGDLGRSLITHQSVNTVLAQRVPVTAELIVVAILIALIIAVPVAVLSAMRTGGPVDRIGGLVAMVGLSVPGFVVGLALILVVSVKVKIFPATGYTALSDGLLSNLRTIFLPALSLSFVLFATYSRVLRADMVEQLTSAEYVVAARARGISSWAMMVRHVLRNSIFGLVTVVGLNLGTLFGATVVIESVFALPGVGSLLVTSITDKDSPTVQGVVVVMAVAVVVANLLTDLLYSVLDPRVRYGNTGH